jgi:chemotaxis protein methyltransferase CheR
MPAPNLIQPPVLQTQIKSHEADFIRLIGKRLGIIIHRHQAHDLYKVISEACEKFDCTPESYLQKITVCPYDSPLLEHLIYGITVGETYFFRDQRQMKLLQEYLLPELIRAKREKNELSLRIWSSAASSGEEIYTIAMMLNELLPDIKAWTIQLKATDINTRSLQKAMAARYSEWSMRTISQDFKEKYFIKDGRYYQLIDHIRKMVRFDYLNLNDDNFPSIATSTNAQDLILCCNVLIYFDNDHIAELMHKLANCLVPEGILLLGASDPINLSKTDLAPVHRHGVYYTNSKQEKKPEPRAVKIEIKKTLTKIIPAIKAKIAPVIHAKPPTPVNPSEQIITQFLQESRWHELLDTLNTYDAKSAHTVFLLNAKATALANLGNLSAAAQCCQDSLTIEATNKHTYFTYALILIELNQLNKAEEYLRKALFLDHQFVEGHFQLGLLLIRIKNQTAGVKCLQNALAIAKQKNPQEVVSDIHGLTYGRLADILEHEISLYSNARS